MSNIETRLNLLETQYMNLRETVSKLEKIHYTIREHVGLIEYLAKSPNLPDSLEERVTAIIVAVNQIQDELDSLKSKPLVTPTIPAPSAPPPMSNYTPPKPASLVMQTQPAPSPSTLQAPPKPPPINNNVAVALPLQKTNQIGGQPIGDKTIYYDAITTSIPAPSPEEKQDLQNGLRRKTVFKINLSK